MVEHELLTLKAAPPPNRVDRLSKQSFLDVLSDIQLGPENQVSVVDLASGNAGQRADIAAISASLYRALRAVRAEKAS
jgi:hypothetical protein